MKDLVNDGFRNVVKPYIDREDKKSREIIAPVEVSPAEAAHSIGDQIVYNGILYDVTAEIAIGDALATSGAGENISEADDITTQLQNKADKVANATNGNFAGLDSSGNLTDSGKSASSFAKAPTVLTQTLVASGTTITFTGIPTIGNFLINFYSSNGVGFIDIDLSTAGSATLTYPPQSADIQIICEIKEV